MTRASDPTVEAVPLSEKEQRALNDAIIDALYDDGCIEPPTTKHAEHVTAYLAASGYRIVPAATLDRSTVPDDPTLDGTDGAHPAWWRGSDHGYAKGLADRSTAPDEGALREALREALAGALRDPMTSAVMADAEAGHIPGGWEQAADIILERHGDLLAATPKDEPDAPPHSQMREALEEAIEGLLATPRPPSSGPVEDIKAWELAHWRLVTAYGAYRGDHEMCPVPSSVTGQPCLLRDGHPQDSADRFHRYAAATPKDEPDPGFVQEARNHRNLLERFVMACETRSPEAAVSHIVRFARAAIEDIDGLLSSRGYPKDEPDAPLDVAWREVEAALPEGWGIALSSDADPPDRYRSTAGRIEFQWPMRIVGPFYAETPVAALRALRAALSEDSPHG